MKDLLEEACNTNVKREYLISWDEMEIRSGIVICLRQARAVGFAGKMDRSIQKIFDNKISVKLKDIAKQVCQFFIISLDGQMSIPIFACGYEAKNGRKYLEESFRIIKEKIDTASNSRIKIVGGCSDGATASLEFATKQTIFPNYRHLGDFSHLVKRMRNALLSKGVQMEERGGTYQVSMNLLYNLRIRDCLESKDDSVSPFKWKMFE